jgi:hypothetical protein
MVRRHGKKTAIAREEKKKRERGESSTGLGKHGESRPATGVDSSTKQ